MTRDPADARGAASGRPRCPPPDTDPARGGSRRHCVFLGGGAALVTILSASTTDSPDVRARSKNGAGSAEFSWERPEILLYDDRRDGLSSILMMKVNGQQQDSVFNSAGMMVSGPSGEKIRSPPQPVPVRASPNDTVEFRVCVEEYKAQRYVPEDTSEAAPVPVAKGAFISAKPNSWSRRRIHCTCYSRSRTSRSLS